MQRTGIIGVKKVVFTVFVDNVNNRYTVLLFKFGLHIIMHVAFPIVVDLCLLAARRNLKKEKMPHLCVLYAAAKK